MFRAGVRFKFLAGVQFKFLVATLLHPPSGNLAQYIYKLRADVVFDVG